MKNYFMNMGHEFVPILPETVRTHLVIVGKNPNPVTIGETKKRSIKTIGWDEFDDKFWVKLLHNRASLFFLEVPEERKRSLREAAIEIHEMYGWNGLKEALWNLNRSDAFSILDLSDFDFQYMTYDDKKFSFILDSIDNSKNFNNGCKEVMLAVVELAKEYLVEGGDTSVFDVEALKVNSGISLVPLILDIRREEVESAQFYYTSESKERVNVSRLKKTYYGEKLLREIGFTKFTRRISVDDFKRLKRRMTELGLKIRNPKMKM